MTRFKFILLLLLHGFNYLANAEYRVFQLHIYKESPPTGNPTTTSPSPAENQQPNSNTNNSKIIISNLDPEQFVGYYPLLPGEKIKYTDTWLCPGRTSYKDYCKNPRLKAVNSDANPLNEK